MLFGGSNVKFCAEPDLLKSPVMESKRGLFSEQKETVSENPAS